LGSPWASLAATSGETSSTVAYNPIMTNTVQAAVPGGQWPMITFPVYILRLGDELRIVLPEDIRDIGHTDFWARTVSHIVARHFGIPQSKLANLPYCQRRARVVGDRVYYGGKPDPALLQLMRNALGNDELVFVFDDHEKRLREDVREFRRLVKQAGRSA
jgi:hypothetical protein